MAADSIQRTDASSCGLAISSYRARWTHVIQLIQQSDVICDFMACLGALLVVYVKNSSAIGKKLDEILSDMRIALLTAVCHRHLRSIVSWQPRRVLYERGHSTGCSRQLCPPMALVRLPRLQILLARPQAGPFFGSGDSLGHDTHTCALWICLDNHLSSYQSKIKFSPNQALLNSTNSS